MSVRVLLPAALILITSTVVAQFWFTSDLEGQTRRRPSRSAIAKKAKAAENVREAYANAIKALKEKDFKKLASMIYRPDLAHDHVHSHDDHGDHDHEHGHEHDDIVDIEKLLKNSSKEAARMGLVLALFDESDVHPTADGNAAVMLASPPKDIKKYQPEKATEGTTLNSAKGLGGELKEVIDSGLEILDEGDLEEFVDQMLPETELKRLQKTNGKKHLIKRLTDYPTLVQFMKNDLKQLSTLEPKMEDNGRVAIFQLAGDQNLGDAVRNSQRNFKKMPNPPTRTIKFELQNGNWRFFDGGKKIEAEIQRQEYGIPSSGKLQMKWRLTNSGWKIERMPFFKLQ